MPLGTRVEPYPEDVMSNEASFEMYRRFTLYGKYDLEVFPIQAGDTYEIWVEGTKRVALQGPGSYLLDCSVYNSILG